MDAVQQGSASEQTDSVKRTGGTWAAKYAKKIIAWDVAPEKEYFDELFRVSRDQVVWGANYFEMPPTRCFLVWDKLTISESFTMAMCEYAWTSFNRNAKRIELAPQGTKEFPRFHPTEKPIKLYEWIYGLFTKPGMTVFDSHAGSFNSRIAAYNMGLSYVGCEIDETYFALAQDRWEHYTAQQSLFTGGA